MKKSKELFNEVIYKVNTHRGAPMGRASYDERKEIVKERFFDRVVQLDSGGYDKGGAYWGSGNNVRVMYNTDLTYVRFYNSWKPCEKIVKGSEMTHEKRFAPVILWDK